MGLDVFGEVVGAHELFVALGAVEPLLAGVGAAVPLQLVGSGEPLAAEEPVASERPLTAVPAKVGAQVACFAVDFVTAGDVAYVLLLARFAVGVSEPGWRIALLHLFFIDVPSVYTLNVSMREPELSTFRYFSSITNHRSLKHV